MSQFPDSPAFDMPRPLSTGLAVGALVLAIVGMCLPGLGLVGLVLGIVALSKASASPETHGGKGMAIAAIIVGAVSLLLSVLTIVIVLPAVGKVRESARQLRSSTQVRAIGLALTAYAQDNKGWYPESGTDWGKRLESYSLDPDDFVSPRAPQGAMDSFIYVPGSHEPFNTKRIVVYENPAYVERGMVTVMYAGGNVTGMPVDEFKRILEASGRGNGTSDKPGSNP